VARAAGQRGGALNPVSKPLAVVHSTQIVRPVYLDHAIRFNRRLNIHRRKRIPELPEGDLIGDAEPTPALALDAGLPAAMAEAAAPLAAPRLRLDYNQQIGDIATADTASHVCEPSVAMNGNVILVTGNWFACVSTDGGASYRYLNPYKSFPDPPNSGFCCDQVVVYSPQIDHFFWLLQYTEDKNGENVQRIAYASTADVAAGAWRFFDITSKGAGLPGSWLDFPDLSLSDAYLYFTSNAFNGDAWSGTIIARISLQSVVTGQISAQTILNKSLFNFRVAQNIRATAYWASHLSSSRIRVFAWPETQAAATSFDVNVPTWNRGTPYQSQTPDGRNWIGRIDGRMTGAAQAGQVLYFAWTAGAGGVNARPNPYVQVVCVDIPSQRVVQTINLWDPVDAIVCAALGTNSQNDVGVSYAVGGPGRFPTHVVGILTGQALYEATFVSQRGPRDEKWGDYLAVRRCYPGQDRFIASGYTLLNNAGTNDATPNIAIFGR
jgi:hypothetical protein